MKILLDYVFPISVTSAIAAPSTAFLKQVAVVCKPKTGDEALVGELTGHTTMTSVNAKIDSTDVRSEIQQLFNAGMTKVYILLSADLDLAAYLETHKGKFFTLLISSDFTDEDVTQVVDTPPVAASVVLAELTFTAKHSGLFGNDITIEYVDDAEQGEEVAHAVDKAITIHIADGASTATQIKAAVDDSVTASALVTVAIATGEEDTAQSLPDPNPAPLVDGAATIFQEGTGLLLGTFDGVTGVSTDDADDVGPAQAVMTRRCSFFKDADNLGKSMFYAFGKLLSNLVNWKNQQYIEMPFDDGVEVLGDATSLFDSRMSFVLDDDDFGKRLALFCAGGKAIVAPYILKNLRVDMQTRAIQWIALNEPQFTIKEAVLLETRIQKDVIDDYINRNWIESGTIDITLVEENFVASGAIEVPTPKALWRIFGEMTES